MTRSVAIPLAALLLFAGCSSGPQTAHAPTTIPWARAEALVLAGEVIELAPRRDGTVRIRLADGRRLVTDEPVAGEALRLLERCGEPCANVRIR
jgi:hypothetical protein